MGHNAHPHRIRGAIISIDWMLLSVALIVVLLCLGVFVRIANEREPIRQQGGFLTLGEDDNLLAFEDFTFGAGDWSPGQTSELAGNLGPVLGPFSDDEVSREFDLPAYAEELRLSFDVHLHNAWAENDSLRVAIGDRETLNITLNPVVFGPSATTASGSRRNNMSVEVTQTEIAPRPAEPVLPGAEEPAIQSFRVSIRMQAESDRLRLRLWADTSDAGAWSLDNFALVATGDDGT